ncbi:MAG: 30S ribosomal protein S8 [Patescibacteria group bacterium]
MTDPITDMLNRIRNAQAVLKDQVALPFSKIKYEIAKILEREGFIEKVEKKGRKIKKIIEITLKYTNEDLDQSSLRKNLVISGLTRISKPGQRIYVKARKIKIVKSGYGIAIISTPKGLMTNKEARRQKLGGEVICEIW